MTRVRNSLLQRSEEQHLTRGKEHSERRDEEQLERHQNEAQSLEIEHKATRLSSARASLRKSVSDSTARFHHCMPRLLTFGSDISCRCNCQKTLRPSTIQFRSWRHRNEAGACARNKSRNNSASWSCGGRPLGIRYLHWSATHATGQGQHPGLRRRRTKTKAPTSEARCDLLQMGQISCLTC